MQKLHITVSIKHIFLTLSFNDSANKKQGSNNSNKEPFIFLPFFFQNDKWNGKEKIIKWPCRVFFPIPEHMNKKPNKHSHQSFNHYLSPRLFANNDTESRKLSLTRVTQTGLRSFCFVLSTTFFYLVFFSVFCTYFTLFSWFTLYF